METEGENCGEGEGVVRVVREGMREGLVVKEGVREGVREGEGVSVVREGRADGILRLITACEFYGCNFILKS